MKANRAEPNHVIATTQVISSCMLEFYNQNDWLLQAFECGVANAGVGIDGAE